MLRNSKLLTCKMVKDSEFFGVDSAPYSVAEAQAVLDAYVDAGYSLFDAGADHSLDVSGEAGDKILIVWQDADPFVGEYQLRASYFAGKTVVILAVKLDGDGDVESVGLRVNFNSFEAGQVDLNALTFEGTDEFYFYRQYTAFNIKGVSFKKCECHWHRKATLEITALDRVKFWTRDSVDVVTTQKEAVFETYKETGGGNGAETSLTITGMASNSFVKVGKYLYVANNTTGYIHKIDAETMAAVTTLNISNTAAYLATDGKTIYAADTSGRYVKKILIADFSLVVATIDLGAGIVGGPCMCNGLNIFIASDKLYKIIVSSGAVSASAAISGNEVFGYNGEYVISGLAGNEEEINIITLSDFTIRNLNNPSPTNQDFILDETYAYKTVIETIFRYKISDLSLITFGEDANVNMLLYTGSQIIFNKATGQLMRYDSSDDGVYDILTLPHDLNMPVNYDGKFIYAINGAAMVRINYLYGKDSVSELLAMISTPEVAAVLTDDCEEIQFEYVRTRYYIPPESQLELVRQYLITEFGPERDVPDAFKRFSGNRTLFVRRVDAEAFLCEAGSEKKIIGKQLYDNDGVTLYDFDELPCDDNLFLLAQGEGGEYKHFIWYNEEIQNTHFSSNDDTAVYTIKAVYQLGKRHGTEIDLRNTEDKDNSPVEGTVEWNLQDNEFVRM